MIQKRHRARVLAAIAHIASPTGFVEDNGVRAFRGFSGRWTADYFRGTEGIWTTVLDALGSPISCNTAQLALSVARYRRRRLEPWR